jgi:predicted GIY-YIG superfamily endonuclease
MTAASAGGACHIGMVCDLERRLVEHRAGRVSNRVAQRTPEEVVSRVDGLGWEEAGEVERYLETWSRGRREGLVKGDATALALVRRGRRR